MVHRVTALVKPEILVWARKSAGYPRSEDAAKALGVLDEKLGAWENGQPLSLSQLRELSRVYKRPLAVFYLQEVPRDFMALSDLRRHPENQGTKLSPELVQEIRSAQQRRELALELAADLGSKLRRIDLSFRLNENADDAAAGIRKYLQVDVKDLSRGLRDSDGRKAYNFWRQRIEDAGILVFQMTKVASSEASGFAVSQEVLPVIGVNRKDPPTRRLFSLLHELAHLAVRKSGVSDLNFSFPQVSNDVDVELFCNRVAAATLMPNDALLNHSLVSQYRSSRTEWSDFDLSDAAAQFSVSREAFLLRLVSLKLATWKFFKEKRDQWNKEYQERKLIELSSRSSAPIPRDMPQEAMSNLGRLFLGLVLENYHQDRITLSEVSGYVGIKTRHIRKLESKFGVLL